MKINDCVYGEKEINEPVLVELINSLPVQRLKGISQYGLPRNYYHKEGYSRFEHSIGVLILLRKMGAELKEQIAGLLHDVSHTAFSHVVDWVVGNDLKEDFQDKNHLNIIKNSEIPSILKKYGFDFNEISKLDDFSLLEKEMPDLCADRVDYTLRELKHDNEDVGFFILNLKNKDNEIIFSNLESGKKFCFEYLRLQREHWAGEQAKVRYYILSNALKKAIEKKIICFDDLYNDDEFVLNILEKSGDKEILGFLDLLKGELIIKESFEGIVLGKKFRHVDAFVDFRNKLKRVSELDSDYKNSLEKERKNSTEERRVIF